MKRDDGFMGFVAGISMAYIGIEIEKKINNGDGSNGEKLLKKIGAWSCVLTTLTLISDIHNSANIIKQISKAAEFNMHIKL